MANQGASRLDSALNAVTIVVAVILLVIAAASAHRRLVAAPANQLTPGAEVLLRGVDWESHGQTLIFALQPQCGPTEANLGLYRDILTSIGSGVHPMVVTPHPVPVGKRVVEDYGLAIADVHSESFLNLNIPGSPTLLLVDANGRLEKAWIGRIRPGDEDDVFETLNVTRVAAAAGVQTPHAGLTAATASAGDNLVLDTRAREDVAQSPIRGAVMIPLDELQIRLVHEMPRDQRLVVVCDYCADCETGRPKTLPSRCDVTRRVISELGFERTKYVGRIDFDRGRPFGQ